MRKKCVCHTECQTRTDDGLINYYMVGAVDYFENCPTHFTEAAVISKSNIDFMVVNPSVLMDEDIVSLADIVAFHSSKFNEDISGEPRKEAVRRLVHARAKYSSIRSHLGQPVDAHKLDVPDAGGMGIKPSTEALEVEVAAEEKPTQASEEDVNTILDGDSAEQDEGLMDLLKE